MATTLKFSRQREAVKTYLHGRTDHPTAEQIYTDLRRDNPRLSLGTVYRNLTLLSEMGEIRKISTLTGPDHFDADTTMHYHFCCKSCGRMSDIPMAADETFEQRITAAAEGSVEGIDVIAYGVCPTCTDTPVRS